MKEPIVLKNIYRDSFELMNLASQIRNIEGLSDIAIFIGTSANKERLENLGFSSESLASASNNDICVGIEYETEAALEKAEKAIEKFLKGGAQSGEESGPGLRFKPRSLEKAKDFIASANLVSISLPGEYAAQEAEKALELGMNVFLFSDNVSIEDEVKLKKSAETKNLLLMGPDCGTAMIRDIPLGFCNIVSRGPIGLVAASGTGAQEIICLLDQQKIGISHVIGTGGRDLHKNVRGLTSKLGLNLLNLDPGTKIIIFISKPADNAVENEIIDLAKKLDKFLICCFIGSRTEVFGKSGNVYKTGSLTHAVNIAAALLRDESIPDKLILEDFLTQHIQEISTLRDSLKPSQQYLRGLYSGGTLAYEAAMLLSGILPEIRAGEGFENVLPIENWDKSEGNTIIDLGDDRFTVGRPHPMIDASYRLDRLLQEAKDPAVGVILMDIVLGTNTFEDPASRYIPAIKEAIHAAEFDGRELAVIIHICASEGDENKSKKTQAQQFSKAGCYVFSTNEEAAFMAGAILKRP